MAKLDYAEAFFAEKLSVGSAVTHKRFGVGTITGLSGKVIEAQFSGLDHPSTLVWRDCVKTGLLSFKTAENAGHTAPSSGGDPEKRSDRGEEA